MGGGGGFNPIPILTTLVFGPAAGGLVATAMGTATKGSGGGSASAGDSAQAEASRLAEEHAAQARRAEDRRAEEAQLKAVRRQQTLASQAALGTSQADHLGGPELQRANLKEKLGQ